MAGETSPKGCASARNHALWTDGPSFASTASSSREYGGVQCSEEADTPKAFTAFSASMSAFSTEENFCIVACINSGSAARSIRSGVMPRMRHTRSHGA